MTNTWLYITQIVICHIRYDGVQLPLQWRHNGRDGVSNHQPHDCLLNRLFKRRSKKTSKPRVTGLCAGNSPMTCEFPAQRASNAENDPIWWRHHARWYFQSLCYLEDTHAPLLPSLTNQMSKLNLILPLRYFRYICWCLQDDLIQPDSKVHGSHMEPIWGRQEPGGHHVGPMNFAIWDLQMMNQSPDLDRNAVGTLVCVRLIKTVWDISSATED